MICSVLGMFMLYSNHAQTIDTVRPSVSLGEVVVTAQFKPTLIQNAIIPVRVISENQLKLTGAHQLRDALLQELSFDISQASVFGGSPQINGISKENIKILVNGIPVIGRLDGVIDLNQIPLQDVRRVEIIEGPSSVYHGTDALGGTINIITNTIKNIPYGIRLGFDYESIGSKNVQLTGIWNRKKHHIQAGANRYIFDGVSFKNQRAEDWESRNQNTAYLEYAYLFNNSGIQFRSQVTQDNLFDLNNPDTNNVAKDIHYSTNRWVNSMNANHQLKKNHFFNLNLAHSYYKRYQQIYTTDLKIDESKLNSDQSSADTTVFQTIHGKLSYSYSPEKKWYNILLGSEWNHETTEGKRILNRSQAYSEFALYSGVKLFPVKNLSLEPSMRWSSYSYDKSVLTPSVSVKYNFLQSCNVWMNYSKGFRTPTLKELYLDFYTAVGPVTYHITGNQELKSESSDQYQLGLKLNSKFIPLKHAFSARAYYNELHNLIALSPIVQNKRNYININQDKTYSVKWEFEISPLKNISLGYGHHLLWNRNDFYSSTTTQKLDEYLLSKDFNAKLNYCIPKFHSTFSLLFKQRGSRPAYAYDKTSKTYFATKTKVIDNLDLFYLLSLWKDRIEIKMAVKNILDQTNIEEQVLTTGSAHNSSLFLYGRTFQCGVSINLNQKTKN